MWALTSRRRNTDDFRLEEDVLVKITFEENPNQAEDPLYDKWVDNSSAERSDPLVFASNALRELHPGYSVVIGQQANLFEFPGAVMQPIAPEKVITTSVFFPMARRLGANGALVDLLSYGAFRVAWDNYDFIVYITKYSTGYMTVQNQFILHEGSEEPSRSLLLAVGIWQDALHDEIWVFNQGHWYKDSTLYTEIQKASWADIIMDEKFKSVLQKDVYGFFDSEAVYRELSIPWKRGLIFHGSPGNGKTITVKAIMKTCLEKGYVPLYVRSFTGFMGDEASIALVFEKARSQAPCVIVLEDLDSLITDRNRSFFLNQIDGLEGNDGTLVVATTNHFETLDPGLSSRPSRFDRKYLFDNPTWDGRMLYVKYWEEKLKNNREVSFPDTLRTEIADLTNGFSFAYLKEVFVSSLVLLAGLDEDKKPAFGTILKEQIAQLRSQLDQKTSGRMPLNVASSGPAIGGGVVRHQSGPAIGGGVVRHQPQHMPCLPDSAFSSGSKIYRMDLPSR